MRIIFICGSLEPGRDGVGDYSRRLAYQLQDGGHFAGIISLNDKFIEEEYDGTQNEENVRIPILRLPDSLETKRKIRIASKWINLMNPDWLSLQYVVFAFHNRGLPVDLSRQLAYLGQGRKWHVMFHEIWVGINKEASIKIKLLGYFQKFLIQSIIKKLKPQPIHTHCGLYQACLNSCGITANQLPLFSNIPVLIDKKERAHECSTFPDNFLLVIFGPIHYEASHTVQEFVNEAVSFELKYKQKIIIQLIGRTGSKTESWIRILEKAGLTIENYGEQPVDVISKVLSEATIGISTTPLALVEKSGTASAMREHGLSILCMSPVWTPIIKGSVPFPNDVVEYTKGKFESILLSTKKHACHSGVGEVAKQFINSLVEPTQKDF